MLILAIESSCDETACAVVEDGTKIISNVVATSAEMHQKYGGIVPEVAARRQLESILPVITEALKSLETQDHPAERDSHETYFTTPASRASETIKRHINAIAVTVGPGLIGSLLIGVETAKAIAFATGLPIIPVNHVLAHMFANFIQSNKRKVTSDKQNHKTIQQFNNGTIEFPAISLVVSGGHTELYLMESEKKLTWLGGTIDDAAGECFDKTARLLGFGSSGGAAIAAAAAKYQISNPPARLAAERAGRAGIQYPITLPRPMMHDESLNFSFSGLKTAVMREWKKYELQKATSYPSASSGQTARGGLHKTQLVNAFSYEVQEAITDVLVKKTLRAAQKHEAKSILISGGVAANIRLREKFFSNLKSRTPNLVLHVPPIELCTDNAAYIGSYAYFYGKPIDWHDITAIPDLSVEVTA